MAVLQTQGISQDSHRQLSFCLLAVFISGVWMRKPGPIATRWAVWALEVTHVELVCPGHNAEQPHGHSAAQRRVQHWALAAAVSTRAWWRFHSIVDGTCPCFKLQVRCCVLLWAFLHSLSWYVFLDEAGAWLLSPYTPTYWQKEKIRYQRDSQISPWLDVAFPTRVRSSGNS